MDYTCKADFLTSEKDMLKKHTFGSSFTICLQLFPKRNFLFLVQPVTYDLCVLGMTSVAALPNLMTALPD